MDVNRSHLKVLTLLLLVEKPEVSVESGTLDRFIEWVKSMNLTQETLSWLPCTGRFTKPQQTLWLETNNMDTPNFEFNVVNTTTFEVDVLADSLFEALSQPKQRIGVETLSPPPPLTEHFFPGIYYFEGVIESEKTLEYQWVDCHGISQTSFFDREYRCSTRLALQLLVVCLQCNVSYPAWVRRELTD